MTDIKSYDSETASMKNMNMQVEAEVKDTDSKADTPTSSSNTNATTNLLGRAITKSNYETSPNCTSSDSQDRQDLMHRQHSSNILDSVSPIGLIPRQPNYHQAANVQRQHSYHNASPGATIYNRNQRPRLQGFFHNTNYTSQPQRFSNTYGRQASLQFESPSQYQPSGFQVFNRPVYTQTNQSGSSTASAESSVRYIRPPVSPTANGYEGPLLPHSAIGYEAPVMAPPPGFSPLERLDNPGTESVIPSTSTIDDLTNQMFASTIATPIVSTSSVWSNTDTSKTVDADYEDSDSDEDASQTHPNKFPVEIEYHGNKNCMYRRQATRSGLKVKQMKNSVYDPLTAQTRNQTHHVKYYQKDLVRICRCGQYTQMDGALVQGRTNDCDGYEIHYSQKCKWKAYDDFKTGARVLIRLCKCYKPT